ncbi:secreted protein [Beggiatoa sp. PS]|nr:secreted protein [Beggiatoa sp. PS]
MITQRRKKNFLQRRVLFSLLISLGLVMPIINANAQEQPVDFSKLTAEQMATLSPSTFSSMTADQIAAIPPAAFLGMTAEQMAQFTVELFNQMPSEVVSKVLTNVDPDNITPADAERLLPDGWTLDLSSGTLTAPPTQN